jgi:hypothetical protein
MTDCRHLSDRMPEVAAQRSAWAAAEAAHLASCAECRAEWDLMLAARRLEARAPAVDVDVIATALRQRLAAERSGRPRGRWTWLAASAAAAAAAVAVAVTSTRAPEVQTVPIAVAEGEALVPLPELEELEAAQLDTLLQTLDGSLAGTSEPADSTLGGETEAELERIFAAWEG